MNVALKSLIIILIASNQPAKAQSYSHPIKIMNITKKLSPTQLSPTHLKNPSGNRNAMPGSASCETPATDAITNNPNTSALHKGAILAHHARKLERTVADAANLIAQIMRNEVNAEDECEKWLRGYAPQHLFPGS